MKEVEVDLEVGEDSRMAIEAEAEMVARIGIESEDKTRCQVMGTNTSSQIRVYNIIGLYHIYQDVQKGSHKGCILPHVLSS